MMTTHHLFDHLNKDFFYQICTHVNPDLDAVSSLLSLLQVMHSHGYKVSGKLQEEPPWMNFLSAWDLLHLPSPNLKEPFRLISLDCGSKDRIWPENITTNALSIINIDHHFDNPLYGTVNICEPKISSTAELLYRLFKNDKVQVQKDIALNLYAGMLFDTGGFRYSNTTGQTFQSASELIALGVNPSLMADKVFTNWMSKGFCALQLALSNVEYFEENQILFSFVSYEEIAKNELLNADFEGVIDILRLHRDTRFTILVRELSKNYFKGSVRAKEPYEIGKSLQSLNGGGHKRAAGFAIQEDSIDVVKSVLLTNLKKML